jgi:hypothetical protein
MALFTRRLDDGLYRKLVEDPLFTRLSSDPEVFSAVRDNRVDFYHAGGKLFTFDGSFKTHIKYASVYDAGGRNYIRESELGSLRSIATFNDDQTYSRMKENCRLYAGIEAAGVSEIYRRHSYRRKGDVVVLDIEIAFGTKDDTEETEPTGPRRKAHERIDLLLFHTRQKALRFVEAKHFSNQELWARPGRDPCVVAQLGGYERELRKRQREILEQYGKYVSVMNKFFHAGLPPPVRVDGHVPLLVFGFGSDDKAGRLGRLGLRGTKQYAKGSASQVSAEVLWRKTT